MTDAGEIISLHIGQAGCQVGDSCWEMFCLEHNIRQDGIICGDAKGCPPKSFFNLTGANKVVPRALFVDLEPSVVGEFCLFAVDDIRTGKFRLLFNPHNLIAGKEDAANCFARGYFTLGKEIIDLLLHRLHTMAEECSHLQGFFIFRAYGGGTGSGLTASLLESLEYEFPKSKKLEFSVYPAPRLSSVIVEPYNAALATHLSLEHSCGCFLIDNEACYDICDRLLDICSPTLNNINRLMGQIVSAVTASLRFGGEINVDLNDIETNLIPYPRIQYPLISYSPLMSKKQTLYENPTVSSLLDSCFEPSHQMVKCDTRKGKYMACTILFRGDVANSSVNAAISSIKSKKAANFVDWCPTGFKVGINSRPPVDISGGDLHTIDKSCLMLANSTAVRSAWEKVARKFDLMYEKKAFLHWYISEGLEEADFQDTRLDLEALDADYKEVEAI